MTGLGHQITKQDFMRIGGILRAYLRRAGLSADEADDLVQETFLHAQKGLDEGRFDGRSSLATWVIGIGKLRLLKYRKSQHRAKRTATEVALDAPGELPAHPRLQAATADPAEHLLARQVVDSLRQLPASLREPLVLVANGRSYKEAATALGITTDLVTSRVHQARVKLRELYARSRPPSS